MERVKKIVQQAESERHFSYFEDRERMWKIFTADDFKLVGKLVGELETLYSELTARYRNIEDGYILLQQGGRWDMLS